jgi:hypothetical protein
MGIVAVGAEIVSPLAWAGKVSHPFSMNTGLPVLIDITMTFTAEPMAFGKVDQLPIVKTQLISILCIVAIETPSHRFSVMELDIGVLFFQFPLFSIHFNGGMTIITGVNPFCKGWRRYGKILVSASDRGCKTKL